MLHRHLYAINKVRNRVAHNERLFNPVREEFRPSLVDTYIVRLMDELSPEATHYLYGENNGRTPFEVFCEQNPRSRRRQFVAALPNSSTAIPLRYLRPHERRPPQRDQGEYELIIT